MSYTKEESSRIQFNADHYPPAHPDVVQGFIEVNQGDEHSYGDDKYTAEAERVFKQQFGEKAQVYFVAGGGTAANVLALSTMLKSYGAVVCTDIAHINNDEAGAPEKFTGAHLLALPSQNGKLTPEALSKVLGRIGDIHVSQPQVVSLTQPTERGTVYSIEEISELVLLAHQFRMYVHMDGARIFNAAAKLGTSVRAFTTELGIDVVSVGAGKNGGLSMGEAVVFLNPELARNFEVIRKQSMQLVAKMRMLSFQWPILFKNDLIYNLAEHSNAMATRLAASLIGNPEVKITTPVETNGVWAAVLPKYIEQLEEKYSFYPWGPAENNEYRWMTSYNTTPEVVDQFAYDINQITQSKE